jgi:hypothetical protein
MRRTLATLTVLLCTAAFASGCGGQDESPSTTEPTSTEPNSAEATPTDPASTESGEPSEPADEVQQIEVTIVGDSVTPSGERVEVSVGEPVELIIESDQPGEIHVHSSPEQGFEYAEGTTTLELDPIERPGVIEVESHTLEKTIVQLEAR